MSKTGIRRLISALGKWPSDANKIYHSFPAEQLERLEKQALDSSTQKTGLFWDSQVKAVETLVADTSKRQFAVNEALLKPDGMPDYYERIKREAVAGQARTNVATSIRESVFGWFK